MGCEAPDLNLVAESLSRLVFQTPVGYIIYLNMEYVTGDKRQTL